MKYIKPDFYDAFRCSASRCVHSCCVGWEIDIDNDTAEYYSEIQGELGEQFRSAIAFAPEPHFIMTPEGRCPFLRSDGLCRLIITLGEGALCDICAEHPRFYNFTGGREERGLGLCCEEVVRLLYSSDATLRFDVEDDGEPDYDSREEAHTFELREEVFRVLSNRAVPLHERMRIACAQCGADMPYLNIKRWAAFYLTLERLNDSWRIALESLRDIEDFEIPNTPQYERLAMYFVYRHFLTPDSIRFAVLSTAIVAALDSITFPEMHAENLRMYSEEIEYSDENINKIFAFMNNIC